jgi:exo-1,4-beta-D-glucosaminidase
MKNTSNAVAFMVHARLTKGPNGDDLVPVLWSDNYFSLLPGEEKTITASFASADLGGHGSSLMIDGYNVAPTEATFEH